MLKSLWEITLNAPSKQTLAESNTPSGHVLGICEHHSRLAVTLKQLPDKASITLLRCLLGIRHQTTEKHCPWQNGRIERFFGTFKTHIRQILIDDGVQLDEQLVTFCWCYNHIRPHQNLGGRTPAEAWLGVVPPKTKNWCYVSLWHGALRGFYVPP
ncbi:integrase core domain-containing protein [Nitrincola sp. A-D6]|uniref:integrase core domain-containing protein n=1 Tax=Nitrincola sp. A-D6 TaxID=1545442 RepID=UPI0013639E9C|nr:integrase core domain-containing protein [Nitrincola sp. A-D6]